MKKWPLLLILPVCVGFYVNSAVRAQDTTSLAEPRIETQAELDTFARQHPDANFDKLGHAFANSGARLFWNTDLEAAKKQAALEGKPILALRLLGNLNDEYSCANSRFFRVLFYPQAQINEKLRRDFVLFWSSERPVPIVTIDMGDGRILKRTLTGNSAHYLLDETGRPLDVFPGLATPASFDSWLASSQKLAQGFKAQPQAARAAWLAKWHGDQLRQDVSLRLGKPTPALLDQQVKQTMDSNPLESTAPIIPVAARFAAPLAISKIAIEAPLLGTVGKPAFPNPSFVLLNVPGSAPTLDAATRARIRAMNPLAFEKDSSRSTLQNVGLGQPRTQSGPTRPSDTPLDSLIRSLEADLQSDTLQNQNFSIPIHALFAQGHEGDLTSLNRRIYDRLFLTPRSDQWLGLTTDTAFSALQNDGITLPAPTATTLTAN